MWSYISTIIIIIKHSGNLKHLHITKYPLPHVTVLLPWYSTVERYTIILCKWQQYPFCIIILLLTSSPAPCYSTWGPESLSCPALWPGLQSNTECIVSLHVSVKVSKHVASIQIKNYFRPDFPLWAADHCIHLQCWNAHIYCINNWRRPVFLGVSLHPLCWFLKYCTGSFLFTPPTRLCICISLLGVHIPFLLILQQCNACCKLVWQLKGTVYTRLLFTGIGNEKPWS